MLSRNENNALRTIVYEPSEKLIEKDMGENTDRALWESFKKGDELAFIKIYQEYASVLINYGCQFTADREMVKDCLQDFFIYLRKNRAGFGRTDSIKMYLFKAFRRRIIDYLKRCNREIDQNERFAFFQFPVELSSETIFINRQIELEQLKRLNIALKNLDRQEREAIYYFYYEGLSYEQIARIFNFSHVSSARRVIYRGLGRLRKLFAWIVLFYLFF